MEADAGKRSTSFVQLFLEQSVEPLGRFVVVDHAAILVQIFGRVRNQGEHVRQTTVRLDVVHDDVPGSRRVQHVHRLHETCCHLRQKLLHLGDVLALGVPECEIISSHADHVQPRAERLQRRNAPQQRRLRGCTRPHLSPISRTRKPIQPKTQTQTQIHVQMQIPRH